MSATYGNKYPIFGDLWQHVPQCRRLRVTIASGTTLTTGTRLGINSTNLPSWTVVRIAWKSLRTYCSNGFFSAPLIANSMVSKRPSGGSIILPPAGGNQTAADYDERTGSRAWSWTPQQEKHLKAEFPEHAFAND